MGCRPTSDAAFIPNAFESGSCAHADISGTSEGQSGWKTAGTPYPGQNMHISRRECVQMVTCKRGSYDMASAHAIIVIVARLLVPGLADRRGFITGSTIITIIMKWLTGNEERFWEMIWLAWIRQENMINL